MAIWRATNDGVELQVKASPGASRDRVVGTYGDALKISVQAAPEGGKANAAIERLLADLVGVPPRDVSVIRGHTQARKTVAIRGVSVERIQQVLKSPASP